MADLMKPNNADSQTPATDEPTSINLNASAASSSGGQDEDTPPAKKAKKRCGVCKKRLGLTGRIYFNLFINPTLKILIDTEETF